MRKILYLTPILGLALSGVVLSGVVPSAWAQQAASPAASVPLQAIQVSPGVMAGNRISGDTPIYPATAKAAQVQGTVVLQALISPQGKVENLRVISGPPMLQQAALDAVRTWTYRPYLLSGGPGRILTKNGWVTAPTQSEPVAVRTQINVVFSLAGSPPAAAPDPQNSPAAGTGAPAPAIPPPPPAHPITTEQVHELMQMTGAVNLTKQMLDGMMPTLRQTMPPYMPPDVLDDFERTLLGADFEAMLVHTYQAHLSTEDAAQIIAFYNTPAGQHMLAAMPQIAKESQQAGQQLGEQVMIEVLQRHQAEIEAAKEKYEAQHPWSAPNN